MFKSSANIRPSRFIKRSGVNTVAECGAGERIFGIGLEFSNYAPLPNQSEFLSESGHAVSFVVMGDHTQEDRPLLLVLGAGGATQGDLLKSGAAGVGIVADTDKDCYGALALESGSAGEAIKVQPLFGYFAV